MAATPAPALRINRRIGGLAGATLRSVGRSIDTFFELIAAEMAPRPRRLRTAIRMATIGAVGAGAMAACHVDNVLGGYIVWILVGTPAAMLRPRGAILRVALLAAALALSVPIAGMFVDTPWLMLPLLAAFVPLSAAANSRFSLGSFGLILQVTAIDSFYGVVFAPNDFGWSVASAFGGSILAYGVVTLFDTVLWPDPAERLLLESIASSLSRTRDSIRDAARAYLNPHPTESIPLVHSDMPIHLALFERVRAESGDLHGHGILLASITRAARLHNEAARFMVTARDNVPRNVRLIIQPEFENAIEAICAAVDELAREALAANIRIGADEPPSPAAARVRPAIDALNARVLRERPSYIQRAGAAEVTNLGAMSASLHAMAELVDRPLDESPEAADGDAIPSGAIEKTAHEAQANFRHNVKVAMAIVVGYVAGLTAQRPDLSVILTTIIVTALPTYGASKRKMILRLSGSALGGAISILAIAIVTPNFETLPTYMIACFIVLLISGYAALSSGRISYAGTQIGTTFLLVFAGLSPSDAIYEPLWRVWGILLGAMIVTAIAFAVWPQYASDSMLPRMRRILRATLALLEPDEPEERVRAKNTEISHLLHELLAVADDARIEGRRSRIAPDIVVDACGTMRRIAHRLAWIDIARVREPTPPLAPASEAARRALVDAIRLRLLDWLAFFEGPNSLSAKAALAVAASHRAEDVTALFQELNQRVGEAGFAELSAWTFAERRALLAEMQSLRRLTELFAELDDQLTRVPRPRAA